MDSAHRTLAELEEMAGEVPVVELDYGHVRTNDVKDILAVLAVAVLKFVGYTFASVCRCKGAADSEVVTGLCNFLVEAGCTGALRLRTGQELVVEALAHRVAALRSPARTIVETSPVKSSSSLGAAERTIQTVDRGRASPRAGAGV